MTVSTIGSLFSGIGGLELGLERVTGARVLWQAETDSFCRAVLAHHFPEAKQYADVRDIDDRVECPLRLGRRFIGIEHDAKFADLARRCIEAEAQHSTRAAMLAGQERLFR